MSHRDSRRDRSRSPPPARGEKRGRSRSPPARRGRSRSRSPDRSARYDRNDRYERNDRRDWDRNDRSDKRNEKESYDEFGRLRSAGYERNTDDRPNNAHKPAHLPQTQYAPPKDLKQQRADAEAAKKERLEMVKNITGDTGDNKKSKPMRVAAEGEDDEEVSEEQEEEDMMAALGFSGFNSTKGKQVVDNAVGPAAGAVQKHKERKYRQYMNRRGGFNRPLQKMD